MYRSAVVTNLQAKESLRVSTLRTCVRTAAITLGLLLGCLSQAQESRPQENQVHEETLNPAQSTAANHSNTDTETAAIDQPVIEATPLTVSESTTNTPSSATNANALTSDINSATDFESAVDLSTEISPERLRQSAGRQLSNYLDEIEKVEIEYGPYSNQLSEQLSGLGRTYQDLGRHGDAIEVFKRAAHVSRINYGLYSLDQVPIIESMTESFVQRGQWGDAGSNQEYLLWLYKKNYEDDDPRMLPVMSSLSDWFLSFHAMHFNWDTIYLVSLADDMFHDSRRITINTYGDRDLRNADPLKGLIRTNWFFRNMGSLPSAYTGYQTEFVDTRSNEIDTNPKQRRLDTKYLRSTRDGRAAINQLIALYAENPEAPPGAEAQAIVELGDWDLLNGDPVSALRSYKDAQQKLAENHNAEVRNQVDKIFGRPMALPDLPLLDSVAGVSEEEQAVSGYVVAQFDVTQLGNVRNVRILESMPENDIPNRKRVKTSLANTKFRPRFVDGEPVYTEHLIHRYVFHN